MVDQEYWTVVDIPWYLSSGIENWNVRVMEKMLGIFGLFKLVEYSFSPLGTGVTAAN